LVLKRGFRKLWITSEKRQYVKNGYQVIRRSVCRISGDQVIRKNI